MTHRLPTIAALVLTVAAGCSSPRASTGEEVLAGTADTAYVVRDGVTFLLWDVPKFVLWTVPKTIVYDYPRSAILAIRGNRAQVSAAISELAGEPSPEDEVRLSEELRYMTGLPIRASERWVEWWQDAEDRPREAWRSDFVSGAIHDLESRDYFIRSTAIEDLRTMYGTTLGYDPKEPRESRAAAADRWRDHFREKGLPPLP